MGTRSAMAPRALALLCVALTLTSTAGWREDDVMSSGDVIPVAAEGHSLQEGSEGLPAVSVSDVTLLSLAETENVAKPHPKAATKAAKAAAREKQEAKAQKAATKMKAQLSQAKLKRRQRKLKRKLAQAKRAKKRKQKAKKAMKKAGMKRKKAESFARKMRHVLSKAQMKATKAAAKVSKLKVSSELVSREASKLHKL